jgi:primosomal protein N' (replication factor Y)
VEAANSTSAIVKALIEKEIFEDYYIQEDRVNFTGETNERDLQLSVVTKNAFMDKR